MLGEMAMGCLLASLAALLVAYRLLEAEAPFLSSEKVCVAIEIGHLVNGWVLLTTNFWCLCCGLYVVKLGDVDKADYFVK
jgi:hypothetical protein